MTPKARRAWCSEVLGRSASFSQKTGGPLDGSPLHCALDVPAVREVTRVDATPPLPSPDVFSPVEQQACSSRCEPCLRNLGGGSDLCGVKRLARRSRPAVLFVWPGRAVVHLAGLLGLLGGALLLDGFPRLLGELLPR